MSPTTKSFDEATKTRRTYYGLEPKTTIPDPEIIALAEQALLTVPSAFNNQSTRISIVFKEDHKKLWDIVAAALLTKIGEERFNSGTRDRIAGFKRAYGTVLFWDDPGNIEGLKSSGGSLYADKAEEWTHQSNGMHQYFMWTALEAHGLGVNLQHYNPLIDEDVKMTWGLPKHWDLKAQMVFGTIQEGYKPKHKEQKLPLNERLRVFGHDDHPTK